MIKMTLLNEIKSLKEGFVIFVEADADKLLNTNMTILKELINNKYNIILVLSSRPCTNLDEIFSKNKIKTDNILILDTVCRSQKSKVPEKENVIHLQSHSDLTNMEISISEALNRLKGNKIVIFESINSMLIHNNPGILAKYIHSILTRVRINNSNCILMSIKNDTNKQIRAELAQLCDKIITI